MRKPKKPIKPPCLKIREGGDFEAIDGIIILIAVIVAVLMGLPFIFKIWR